MHDCVVVVWSYKEDAGKTFRIEATSALEKERDQGKMERKTAVCKNRKR